jgi:hypothetical protein
MRPVQHDSYVAGIDDEARAELVREVLQDRRARLVSWREEPMGGGGSGSELYTISGEATSSGTVLPWKFILKMFNHEGEGWQEGSTDPMAWDFWKREWLVYQAPWIQGLREGLVAPRCFGSGELAETAVWVAMEDLTAANQRPWSLSRFAAAARHLGEFNGRFLVGSGQPADWWLSRGWLRGWTERAEPMITKLPSLAEHPVVTELFAPSTIGLLLRVWEHRHDLHDALDALPQSICHQDLFPRNAFIRVAGGAEQTVAIDWAFCGSAALGADLAPLLGASLGFFEADCDEADELERLCMNAYLDGLRLTGWQGHGDDIFLGYLATIALRFMVGAVGPVLTFALDNSLDAMGEQIFGHPKRELIARWRKIHEFFDEPRLASLLTTFGYA